MQVYTLEQIFQEHWDCPLLNWSSQGVNSSTTLQGCSDVVKRALLCLPANMPHLLQQVHTGSSVTYGVVHFLYWHCFDSEILWLVRKSSRRSISKGVVSKFG
jgi:hypothetical protein